MRKSTACAWGRRIVIVGHGNVAIDLLRLFLTPAAQLRALDIANDVVDAVTAGPVHEVDIVGRSQPGRAKFDVQMIRELDTLSDVAFEATVSGVEELLALDRWHIAAVNRLVPTLESDAVAACVPPRHLSRSGS